MQKSIVVQNPAQGTQRVIFIDGSDRHVVELPSLYIGTGTYKPGWRWSVHAGPQAGKSSVRHIGYIISGSMMVKDAAGRETMVRPGEAFEIGPDHDAWVIGDAPCVALDFEIKPS